MIVLIEGADCVGKSTLCSAVAEMLGGAEIIHCEKPKLPPVREYFELINSLCSDMNYVIDRAWLSEIVYSQLWRGGRSIGDFDLRFLERFAMSKHRCAAIHAFADEATVIDRMRRRGEKLLSENQVHDCLALFRDVFYKDTALTQFNYDSSRWDAKGWVDENYHMVEHVLHNSKLYGE